MRFLRVLIRSLISTRKERINLEKYILTYPQKMLHKS